MQLNSVIGFWLGLIFMDDWVAGFDQSLLMSKSKRILIIPKFFFEEIKKGFL
jgi:hypothetical protein